jgi:hypothetical protein
MKTKNALTFSQQPANGIQRELDEVMKNSHSYSYRLIFYHTPFRAIFGA